MNDGRLGGGEVARVNATGGKSPEWGARTAGEARPLCIDKSAADGNVG